MLLSSLKLRSQMRVYGKRIGIILLASIVVVFLCWFVPKVYRYYVKVSIPQISLYNKAELISSNEDYLLRGKSNLGAIEVSVNGKKRTTVPVLNREFEILISADYVDRQGWNSIELIGFDPLSHREAREEGFINVIPNQANFFVPRDDVVSARVIGHRSHEGTYEVVDNYSFRSPYLDKEELDRDNLPENFMLDEAGIPMYHYYWGWEYNPVMIAQNALGSYGAYLSTGQASKREDFLSYADWLLNAMEPNGSYPYPFSFELTQGFNLPEGFISSMAQGQVLSVFVRAYDITGDERYLRGGGESSQLHDGFC